MAEGLFQVYQCGRCGTARRRPHSSDPVPSCCDQPMAWRRTMTLKDPPPPRFGKAPGIDFRNTNPIHVPIGEGGMYFESLHAIREFERQSEQLAAEGIGQPYRIRGYSQDRSNMSVNTFGEPEVDTPDLTRLGPDGKPRVRITSHDAPTLDDDVALGPGAVEALASALPMDPGN